MDSIRDNDRLTLVPASEILYHKSLEQNNKQFISGTPLIEIDET